MAHHQRQRALKKNKVTNDGNGVLLNDKGQPDFNHIATHICDSMKRHLSRRDRVGVHGEFGIGLLSFWSLGEQLRTVSGDENGRLYEFVLIRGEQTSTVKPLRGAYDTDGTQIVIGPLLEVGTILVWRASNDDQDSPNAGLVLVSATA